MCCNQKLILPWFRTYVVLSFYSKDFQILTPATHVKNLLDNHTFSKLSASYYSSKLQWIHGSNLDSNKNSNKNLDIDMPLRIFQYCVKISKPFTGQLEFFVRFCWVHLLNGPPEKWFESARIKQRSILIHIISKPTY